MYVCHESTRRRATAAVRGLPGIGESGGGVVKRRSWSSLSRKERRRHVREIVRRHDKREVKLLAATQCKTCRKELVLAAPDIKRKRIGFRCHFCGELFCNRCAKKHFGDLTRYGSARGMARILVHRLKEWIGKEAPHAKLPFLRDVL